MRIPQSLALLTTMLTVALVLGGCATQGIHPAPVPHAAVAGPLDTPQARASYHIMVGTLAASHRQPKLAAEQYLAATRAVPNAQLSTQATALALMANDDPLALEAATELARQKPTDPNALGTLLDLAVRNDQIDTAVDAGKRLLQLDPTQLDKTYRQIAETLSEGPDLLHARTARQTMTQLVALHEDAAGAHYALGLLALRQRNGTIAAQQAERTLQLGGNASQGTFLLVAARVLQGRLTDADHLVRHSGSQLPGRTSDALQLGYAEILLKYGQTEHARTWLSGLLARRPNNADLRILLARVDISLNRPDDALRTLAPVSHSDTKQEGSIELELGRIAELRRDYPQAITHYQRAASEGQNLQAGVQEALVLGKTGKVEQARNLLLALAQAYPEQVPALVTAESQVLLDAGKGKQALTVLDDALQDLPDAPGLVYQRALIYDRLGEAQKAEAGLRSLLAKAPDDPSYLNGLGFVLTEHNPPDQLGEAHQLIAKALSMAPDNAAVIDSMGWVLYRQGHAEQALPYLHRAYALSDDPEVAAHLITVLAATGNTRAARQTLKHALTRDPHNAALQRAAKSLPL
ncbi:MAG TPA: tetratricopeptide repeat protein [Nevskiaceae bacterium]|nr:tetratricopeptide repeat protein [Nevskiaceae bacterium]